MKIVCSANMPFVEEAFSSLGDVTTIPGTAISARDVRDAEILAIRSTTKVNPSLVDGSKLKFVGTATIGINHMDTEYLDNNGIAWCSSPGCNANSVSEYVTSALLCLAERHGIDLTTKTLGVIGVGNVGSLVAKKAETLGMRVLRNDPPKARAAAAKNRLHNYVSRDIIIKESNVITLHVPLTKDGPDATLHMADLQFFAGMRPRTILINSSRGAVVDTRSLLAAIARKRIQHATIDTWEDEPDISWDLLNQVNLATPHIAGYSFEGKVIGTKMVYDQACYFLGVEPTWTHDELMPTSQVPNISVDAAGRPDLSVLWEIVKQVYDVEKDDRNLRAIGEGDASARPDLFYGLRNNYRIRREFRYTEVSLSNGSDELREKIAKLGFKVGRQIDTAN